MFDAYQVLLDDVPSVVREMLKRNPDLASITVERDQLFETRICHGLYRGDTLLHLAAAGHRNEIIVAFIKAGANPDASKNRRCSAPLHYAANAVLNEHYAESAQESSIRCTLQLICKQSEKTNGPGNIETYDSWEISMFSTANADMLLRHGEKSMSRTRNETCEPKLANAEFT